MQRRNWVTVGCLCAALLGCGKASKNGGTNAAGTSAVAEGGAGTGGRSAGNKGGQGSGAVSTNGGTSAGSGGTIPTNWFVAEVRQSVTDKIDLLVMVDNSIGMDSKQAILAESLPSLLRQFAAPPCVDENGKVLGAADDGGHCAAGALLFPPIKDIHVGVVSSSLGAHGGSGVCVKSTDDDHGQLLPKVRPDPEKPVPTWNDSGFLVWDPSGAQVPPGEGQWSAFADHVSSLVRSAGALGCGFESSLEAWYRFLIDPEPPVSVPTVIDVTQYTQPVYSSDLQTNPVLAQRAQFLRPDSLVGVVMLSDENDCSIIDEKQGWLVGTTSLGGGTFRMPRSTSQCALNPNDPCCSSCASPISGCPALSSDPSCLMDGGSYVAGNDNTNLRCYNQKARFGIDLLYPTQRYVDGLSEPKVRDRTGNQVTNPLYAGGKRDPSMVFLAGIVGVPWQDLAAPAALPADQPLRLMSYQELVDNGRWELILGANDGKQPPGAPGDKLMFETSIDRSTIWPDAVHPIVGDDGKLAPATATGRPNSINGHESKLTELADRKDDNGDLQYACIFPLPTGLNCADPNVIGCDCKASDVQFNRPLCEGTTQTYAKAYPGVRELQVLKDYGAKGANAVVASICPKTLNPDDPSYGYIPAMDAMASRMQTALRPRCLPRALDVDADPGSSTYGQVPCSVIEVTPSDSGSCSCAARPGRTDADAGLRIAISLQASANGYCDSGSAPSCDSMCFCEIEQFSGEELTRCLSEPAAPSDLAGFCYVDPSAVDDQTLRRSESEVVGGCPASQKRILRFVGEDVPARGATTWLACHARTL